MEKAFRKTGIDIIGDAPWGTHFCQFYQTKKDLIDILVPYFKAGLENNEFCMWITSEPLNVEDAKAALKKAVKNLDHFIKKGQIEILDYSEWYTKSGKFDANNVLQDWIEKENQALKRGYDGLRLSGNTFWFGKNNWRNFTDYEEKINNVVGKYRMIAICTYSLGQCGASEVIDVVSNHQFALIRREGKWVIIESSERKRTEEGLRESEEKYRNLFEESRDTIYITTKEGKFIDINQAGLELFGYTEEGLMKLNVQEIYVDPEDRTKFQQEIERKGFIRDYEIKFRKKDGKEIDCLLNSIVRQSKDGSILGYQGIIRDITGLKQAEEALRRKSEEQDLLLNNIQTQIWYLADKETYGAVNKARAEFFGKKKEEMENKKLSDVLGKDEAEICMSGYAEVFEKRKQIYTEEWIMNAKGEKRLLSITKCPKLDENGSVEYVVCSAEDITEHKRAEEELREKELFNFALFEYNPIQTVAVDLEGKVTGFNLAKKRSGDRLPNIGDVMYKDYAGKHESDMYGELIKCIRSGEKKEFREQKYGDKVLSITISHFPKGAVIISEDITERKRVEEALRRSEEKYRDIFENIVGGIYRTTPEGRYIIINPAFAAICGYASPEEMMEKVTNIPKQIYANPEDRLRFQKRIGAEGQVKGFEVQFKTPTRGLVWVSIHSKALRDEQGNICYYDGTIEDITERKRVEEALRKKSGEHDLLLDNIQTQIWYLTDKETYGAVNKARAEFFGKKNEEMENKKLSDVLSQDEAEICMSGYVEVFEKRKQIHTEEWITNAKGEKRLLSIIRSPKLGEDGNVEYVVCAAEDITERKRAEEVLRQSEERFRSVFNNAFVGMAIVNPEGHVVEANETFCRFLGYSREELIGRHFTECTHPEDLSIDSDLYAALLDDERLSYSIDKRYTRKGKVVWGRLSVSLIKDEAGQPESTIVVREDITERKQAEEALRGSEEKYRLLVENTNEAIFVAQEEKLKFVNRKVLEIMGRTQEEITSKPFSDFIHPEDREMVLDNYLRGLREETVPSIYAFRVIDKDGNTRWVELDAVKIDWEGKPATLNFGTDITERKRAEGEMGLLQEQFRHSQKMEAVGRLAGGVAHDFNNLLTVIRGYSELCLGKLEEADPLWRKVEGIRRASEQGSRLTNQLLAFSRHQVMKMKVIDLNRFFKDLDRILRRVIEEDIELVTILAEDLGGVKADLGQMEQVTMNLAVNARDAMPKGGKLTIEAKNVESDDVFFGSHAGGEPGRYVMFSVSDTGFGITPEVKEHIFEPFFTTKGEGKGTGLGLSTVYGIVKQSGGEITVESEVGKGSVFRIYLPLVEGVMEDQKEEEQEAWGGKETVLVVEDEENVRRLVAEVLEGQGYEVLEASGGEEALGMVEKYEGRIDLLLTDVVMPGMSGHELGKRFVERWGMVKVLYMSGFFDEERVPLNVLEEGMNYVQKPFTIDALTRKVREVLDK